MKWSDEYATGIKHIDDHHRMIFKMSKDFRDILDHGEGRQTYDLMLESLERYCRGHFGFEERCMEKYRCPFAQKNRKGHARLLEILSGFRRRYVTSGYQPTTARELVDTIDQWVAEHICRVDVKLKQYVGKA